MENNNSNIYVNTPNMIEQQTGRKFTDICKELISEGLSPTEIAVKLKLKSSRYVNQHLYLDKLKIETKPFFPELEGQKLDFITLEFAIPNLTGMSYKDFLYEKYILEGFSTYQIGAGLGITYKTVHNHIRKYGFHKSKAQASKDAIESGRKNYIEITASSRKTRNKLSGSFSQEIARGLIKSLIEQHMLKDTFKKYEIIVGYNEYGILLDKEVDIPIIIIDNEENKFHKFAIEYNGYYFHKYRQSGDILKENRLTNNGWNLYYIEHSDNTDYTDIEEQMKSVIECIFRKIYQSVKV